MYICLFWGTNTGGVMSPCPVEAPTVYPSQQKDGTQVVGGAWFRVWVGPKEHHQ